MTVQQPVAMTIAGSDSSGGAGIQADLKTFSAFGIYGASALTALTAQNTTGVTAVHAVPADFVVAQIDAVLSDMSVGAIKTGMLANAAIVAAVAGKLASNSAIPAVVDPVMVATSGANLLDPDAMAAVRTLLLPVATVLTPNLPEASRLTGLPEAATEGEMERQGRMLRDMGAKAVLMKGGHGGGAEIVDLLVIGGETYRFSRPRIATRSTHGTGCTLSAAIAALLATGETLPRAVERSKDYVWRAIEAGRLLGIGAGHGPVDHLYAIRRSPPPA